MQPSPPPFWSWPWGLGQVAMVQGGLLALALLIQWRHPGLALPTPAGIWAWIVPLVPVVAGGVAAIGGMRGPGVLVRTGQVLGGAPWASGALVLLILSAAPLAIWPSGLQAPAWLAAMGLADSLHALPLMTAFTAVLLSLGAAIAHRLPIRAASDLGFLALHGGLVVLLVAGIAGAAGLRRGQVVVAMDGGFTSRVQAETGDVALPVGLALERFRLERYPPTLAVSEPAVTAPAPGTSGPRFTIHPGEVLLGPGSVERLAGWNIAVDAYLPQAAVVGDACQPYIHETAGPGVLVRATPVGGGSGAARQGWLHAPTPWGGALVLDLGEGRQLALREPRAKRYAADVVVVGPGSEPPRRVELAVNRPLRVDGWWLYLLTYDEAAGAASRTVVLEAVEDRALPGIYLGLGLLVLGALTVLAGALRRKLVPPWELDGVPSAESGPRTGAVP